MSNRTHKEESPVGGRGADCDAVASRYCKTTTHTTTHYYYKTHHSGRAHLQIFRVSPSQLKIHFQSVPLLGFAY